MELLFDAAAHLFLESQILAALHRREKRRELLLFRVEQIRAATLELDELGDLLRYLGGVAIRRVLQREP